MTVKVEGDNYWEREKLKGAMGLRLGRANHCPGSPLGSRGTEQRAPKVSAQKEVNVAQQRGNGRRCMCVVLH